MSGGGESLTEKTTPLFTHMFLILNKKWNTSIANVKLQCLEQNYKLILLINLLVEDLSPPPHPSVYLGKHWCHSCDHVFPPPFFLASFFAYCKRSKTRWCEAWEDKFVHLHLIHGSKCYWHDNTLLFLTCAPPLPLHESGYSSMVHMHGSSFTI